MQTIRRTLMIGGILVVTGLLYLELTQAGTVEWATWAMGATALAALTGLLVLEYTGRRDHLEDVEALARQDQLATIGMLAASVGHEIRNVISVCKMRLYLARKQTDGQVAEELESTADAISRLEELTDHLAPFADYDGKLDESFRLREAVAGAVDVVSPKTSGLVDLEVETRSNPEIAGCEATFTQVLVNLLLNACDAVDDREEAGHIRIRGDRDGAVARVTVIDDGPGIPEDQLEEIFEPFFTTKGEEHEGGSGIGLWLCRQLVEQRNGLIRAENTDGGGARFVVQVPVRPGVDALQRRPDGARQCSQPSPGDDAATTHPDVLSKTRPRSPRDPG